MPLIFTIPTEIGSALRQFQKLVAIVWAENECSVVFATVRVRACHAKTQSALDEPELELMGSTLFHRRLSQKIVACRRRSVGEVRRTQLESLQSAGLSTAQMLLHDVIY